MKATLKFDQALDCTHAGKLIYTLVQITLATWIVHGWVTHLKGSDPGATVQLLWAQATVRPIAYTERK